MHWPRIQRHLAALAAPALKPGDGVLHPVRIIAFWIILVHVGAAAFLAVDCALDRALGLTDQIVEFERFDQICIPDQRLVGNIRSEEHTSELQSLMRISYAVFCFKKKMTITTIHILTNMITKQETEP